jgi:beta-lactamase regulating signal transducer with metallopeptidase domain
MNFISNTVMEAWGLTLLHSVWQGAVWMILLLVLLRFIRNAVHRYTAGVVVFAGFALTVMLTAIVLFPASPINSDSQLTGLDLVIHVSESTAASQYFNQWMPWFVNFWMLGTVLFFLRMFAGLHYLNRLERMGTADVPELWIEKIRGIAKEIGIHRKVKILNSQLVDMPMVYGTFRPVLLLPVAYMGGLTMEQLEAIFAHELAHIRRHDYAVNFVQHLFEAVFFFNPFVWLISKTINDERELCCDDLAIQYCTNRRLYVKALSELEIYRSSHSGLAMGLANSSSGLIHRIRRLIEPEYRKGGQFKLVIVAVLITLGWIGLSMIDFKEVPRQTYAEASLVSSQRFTNEANLADPISLADTVPDTTTSSVKLKVITKTPDIEEMDIPGLYGKNKHKLELALQELEDVDLDIMIDTAEEAIEDIDLDIIMESALDAIQDIDIDIMMNDAISGINALEFDTTIVIGRLDTSIIVNGSMSREHREALRMAREEMRRVQQELRQVNREELQRVREELMRHRDIQREEWDRMRQQLQKELEENGKISPEQREEIREQMELVQKQMAEEMARQEELTRQFQQQEMQEVEKALQEAERELQFAEQEMQQAMKEVNLRHKEFIQRMEEQLRDDGYLEKGDSLRKLRITGDTVKFNGRKVLEEDLAEYLEIYRDYFGDPVNGTFEFSK